LYFLGEPIPLEGAKMTSKRLGKNIALLTAAAFILAACSAKETPPPEDTAPVAPVEDTMDDGKPDMPVTPPMSAEQLDMEEWGGATASGVAVFAGADRVFFAYDSSDLTDSARATLGKQAAWLMHYPRVRATVEGHCDERGTREYNLALGDRRATAVKNYLVALGVPASRLKTISYGKERPAEPGNYGQNRRGVLRVQ
jgi:peptidoglycan-associated lipoprotein